MKTLLILSAILLTSCAVQSGIYPAIVTKEKKVKNVYQYRCEKVFTKKILVADSEKQVNEGDTVKIWVREDGYCFVVK